MPELRTNLDFLGTEAAKGCASDTGRLRALSPAWTHNGEGVGATVWAVSQSNGYTPSYWYIGGRGQKLGAINAECPLFLVFYGDSSRQVWCLFFAERYARIGCRHVLWANLSSLNVPENLYSWAPHFCVWDFLFCEVDTVSRKNKILLR